MNKLVLILLFFISLRGFSQEIPEPSSPPRLVNDFVGNLLSAEQIASLERKLVAYNDSTSTQVTLVIVKSVKPYEIADFAQKLGQKWGVGQKGKNNGIVFLWAPGDRKVNIQTGKGMEGVLPDIYAKRIISQIIAPNFKNLNYYQGIDQAIDQIYKYAAGEYDAEPQEEGSGIGMLIFLIVLILLFIWIANKNRNNRGGNGGRGLYDSAGWPYTTYTGWGRQSGNWGGGGGGGWSGGGGGGFGGFGGGSFGGGGASGDY